MHGAVQHYKSGGVISGLMVFEKMLTLRIIAEKQTIEENKAAFDRLFENMSAKDDKVLKDFKESAEAIWKLAVPYMEVLLEKNTIHADAEIKVLNEAIASNKLRKVKRLRD